MAVSPLIVDTYAGDLDGKTDLAKLIAAGPPWYGWLGKCTQGNYYGGGAWFKQHWADARKLAGSRYGVTWFRGCYHYLDVRVDPKAQANYYLHAIDAAGGWGAGDLWPVVDVERAGQRGVISAQLVIDRVSEWVRLVKAATGRQVILYGGSYLRELGIKNTMGCSLLWAARYTAQLPYDSYVSIGWDITRLFAWQYCGDGVGKLAGYPMTSPIGKTDISVLTVASGGADAIKYIRNNMCG